MCSNATGCLATTWAYRGSSGGLRCSAVRRSTASSAVSTPITTAFSSRVFTPAACACWRSPRERRTGPGHFPLQEEGPQSNAHYRVSALEFIRLFLQHVLPWGFMKVRYYGFLSSGCRMPLKEVRARIALAHGFAITVPKIVPEPQPPLCCRQCGKVLEGYCLILPPRRNPEKMARRGRQGHLLVDYRIQ
uniref:transposase n=1 Tax=Geothermobacter ehrlichii TaxID=213224 RepID=UPI0038B3486B